ncbi:hypothetical protein [Endozoicomonas sp. ALB032]
MSFSPVMAGLSGVNQPGILSTKLSAFAARVVNLVDRSEVPLKLEFNGQ